MRFLLAAALILGALTAAASSAAPTRDSLIRPGKGIGPLDLGMTETQVRSKLGRPSATRTRPLGFGRIFIELQYDGTLFVGLSGRRTHLRVHSVATLQKSERTPLGFGVGTSEARLARTYGLRLRCERLRTQEGWSPEFVANRWRQCVVGRRGAETVFVTALPPHVRRVMVEPSEWRGLARVIEVRVQRGPLSS